MEENDGSGKRTKGQGSLQGHLLMDKDYFLCPGFG